MKTNIAENSNLLQQAMSCPFLDSSRQDCKAACLSTEISAAQQLCYCETEDYEDCPLFLSRLLRNSRPKFRGVLDLALK